jgi:hypothetical protein
MTDKPLNKADFTLVNFKAKAGNEGKVAGLELEVGTKKLTILASLDLLHQMHREIEAAIKQMDANRKAPKGD